MSILNINELSNEHWGTLLRSSRPEVFCKKDVLRNFGKLTRKHLCQSLFKIKFQAYSEISKNTFFTEHLRWLLLASYNNVPGTTIEPLSIPCFIFCKSPLLSIFNKLFDVWHHMPLILQSKDYVLNNLRHLTCPEAALYRCYYKKVLWKYAANLRESTHGEATLLKSHFDMGVFL